MLSNFRLIPSGLNDDENGEDTTHLAGLSTEEIEDLLKVSKSSISRARNDSDNIMINLKYSLNISRSQIDKNQS